ncbi:MAG TPA: ABC transporter substrate-binding protein [Chloroflexota bacterium]|nr:ABC transporter substrate-binding protein [Chloroflexota bacterium]
METLRSALPRRQFLHLAAIGCASLLAACGGASAATASPAGGGSKASGGDKLRIASFPTSTLNPDPVDFPFVDPHLPLMYTPLIGATPGETDVNLRYGAAEKMSFSDDGKILTIAVRQGLKFHNGALLGAKDVKFSIERSYGPLSTSELNGSVKSVVSKVDLKDDSTVVVTLKGPSATMITELSPLVNPIYIVPMDYYNKVGQDGFAAKPVGSGPYQWGSGERDSFVELKAGPGAHPILGTPTYQTVRFDKVKENTTRVAMLKTGQADIAETQRPSVADLQKANFRVEFKKAQQLIGFYFLQSWDKSTFLNNINVRKAVSMAVDRDTLAKTILDNIGVSPWGVTWPPPFDPSAELPEYQQATAKPDPYDPAQSKKLLADAGLAPNQVRLKLVVTNQFPEQAQLSQAVQQMVNAVGIHVDLVTIAFDTFRKTWGKHGSAGNEMTLFAASNRLIALGGARSVFHTDGAIGLGHDPEIDRTLNAAAVAKSLDEYKKLFTQFAVLARKGEYAPGFFTLDGVWGLNPKLPHWGMQQSRSRFGLALQKLVLDTPA